MIFRYLNIDKRRRLTFAGHIGVNGRIAVGYAICNSSKDTFKKHSGRDYASDRALDKPTFYINRDESLPFGRQFAKDIDAIGAFAKVNPHFRRLLIQAHDNQQTNRAGAELRELIKGELQSAVSVVINTNNDKLAKEAAIEQTARKAVA